MEMKRAPMKDTFICAKKGSVGLRKWRLPLYFRGRGSSSHNNRKSLKKKHSPKKNAKQMATLIILFLNSIRWEEIGTFSVKFNF
jgi:hypothetical protein